MNLVDASVVKILSEPFEKFGKWWVKVEYASWGANSTTDLMFATKSEAEKVTIGYEFQV